MYNDKLVPRCPPHKLLESGTYMVTCGTLHKRKVFLKNEDLDFLQNKLIHTGEKWDWQLQSWSLFPNHYHFIAQSPSNPASLSNFLSEFHSSTASYINLKNNSIGERVWYNYWDTYISHHNSYLSRINYVMKNPVKHGLVDNAEDYPWCSASWFKNKTDNHTYKAVSRYKYDQLNIEDDFD